MKPAHCDWNSASVCVPLSAGERSARVRLQPRPVAHVWQQAQPQLSHGGAHCPVGGLTGRYVHMPNMETCEREKEREIMDRSCPPCPTDRSKVSACDVFQLLPLSSSYTPRSPLSVSVT